MIKKLKAYEETPSGYKHPENLIQDKINEIIETVNELVLCEQTRTCNELIHKDKIKDPYVEQRKWIGKLCHFWNKTEYADNLYGFLTDIVPTNKYNAEDNYFVPFKDEFGSFYEHCEPVKPNDDVIFKEE